MSDKILVKDFMRKEVISCSPEDDIVKAANIMKDNKIGVLVVIKEKSLVGIISERDIINKVVSKNLDYKNTKVKNIMTRKVVVGTPDLTDVEAAIIFAKEKIKKLPILKNKKVVGIITQTDLLKVISFKWAL